MSGANWVVGFHAVVAVLQQNAPRVEVVWLGEGVGGARARQVLELARQSRIRYAVVSRRELDRVAEGVAHNGFAARLAPLPFANPEELLEAPSPACVLALDGVQDPHNLGAVIRVAAAFSGTGLVVAGPHPPPLGGAVAKVAAGTLPLVRVARVGSLGDFARLAKDKGFTVLGADARGNSIVTVQFPERLLLCVGGEEGLRVKTQRFLDDTVAIPMSPAVESLNLAVACGILVWEWYRQWRVA